MRSRRALVGLLVAGVHLALGGLLARPGPGRPRLPAPPATAARGPALVWLRLPSALPADTSPRPDRQTARDPRAATPRPSRPAVPVSLPPPADPDAATGRPGADAITARGLLERTTPGAPAAAAAAADAAAPLTPAASTPLDLRLPRGAAALARHPVDGLRDLTGRAPSVPLEARLAAALGSGRWTEERVDGDTVRLRDGGRCVTLRRPRAGQLDVIGDATRQLPWVSDGVKPCGP